MVERVGQKLALPQRRTFFKEWREFRDLTQQALGDKIGATKAAVQKIETGDSGYSGTTLEAWAWACECEPADLLTRPPIMPKAGVTLRNGERELVAAVIAGTARVVTDLFGVQLAPDQLEYLSGTIAKALAPSEAPQPKRRPGRPSGAARKRGEATPKKPE